jgi:hypothetical protein
MADNQVPSVPSSKRAAIDAFRKKLATQAAGVAPGQRGRLIFGVDCTASREHCWEMAREIQSEMFEEVAKNGGLALKLVYYRGSEFEAYDWVSDGRALADKMATITCVSGNTQIEKVLMHTLRENGRQKVQALVFVGDAMEEDTTALYAIARELGARGAPVFLFQEGDNPDASRAFAEIARLTKGAHCHFTPGAARELAELLRAVAAYAAGGRQALLTSQSASAVKLLQQLK